MSDTDKRCQERQETGIKQVAPNSRLRKMLSLLLKTPPLAERTPHRLMNVQKQILSLLLITVPLACGALHRLVNAC